MNKLLLTIICIVLTISTATASDVVFKFAEGSCYEVVGASSRSDR